MLITGAVVQTTEMTTYEKWAITLSILAIFIPIIQWAWRKWVSKPVLRHLPTGRAFLFINRSGSYIQIEGVYEAENKPISVKNIKLKVIREQDNNMLNLSWSTFTSPVNQKFVGNYTSTSEVAHPFRIEANNVVCAFTEFSDFYDSSAKMFQPYYDALVKDVQKLVKPEITYEQAHDKYIELNSYKEAKAFLEKILFWEIGKYEAILEVEYNKRKVFFKYMFNVSKEDYDHLNNNLNETILAPLKDVYGIPYAFQVVKVELYAK